MISLVSEKHTDNQRSNHRSESGPVNKKISAKALFKKCFEKVLPKQSPEHFNLFQKYALKDSKNYASKIFKINLPDKGTVSVHRAGVLVISVDNGERYAILGEDKYSGVNSFSTWFSRGCEARDQTCIVTIIREGFEESAGMLALTEEEVQNAINTKRFFYGETSHKNQNPEGILAIVHLDKEGKYMPKNLKKSLKNIESKPYISGSMKEMRTYHAVKLNELKEAIRTKKRQPGSRIVVNASNGKITIQGNYSDVLQNAMRAIESI